MYYHGKNLRKCRISETGRPYLITTVTHDRDPLFKNFDIARALIGELRATCNKLDLESLAWVVMPDHLHWMFVLNHRTVSDIIRQMKGKSAYAINKHHAHHGKVWQQGFHDHAIRKDEDIRAIARYIIGNPLRAGLVDNIGDYPFWDAVWL